ncbi:MAG: ribonuclease III [Candidatus Limnocylindria bacterium]
MRPQVEELAHRLGIELSDPGAIAQAFVHSSYYNENPLVAPGHNERLEFLGDAVVSLVVSDILYRRHPDEDEGFLTARRAALVNREALAAIAIDLELERYLLLGRGEAEAGGGSRPSVLAAAFEALAGAVYLAAGVEAASEWLARLFEERLAAADSGVPKSAKSRLQEWSQRNRRLKPTYEVIATSGPPHDQRFTISASVGSRRVAVGEGSSRRRAEEQAAAAALEVLTAELPGADS